MKKGNWKQALEAIEKYDNIIIFHHTRPDGDCLGSQHGLAELIRLNYKHKKVFVVGDSDGIFDFMNYKFNPANKIDFKNSLGVVVDVANKDRIQNVEVLLDERVSARLIIDHHPNESDINFDYTFVDSSFAAAAEMVAELAKRAKWQINKEAASHIYLGINTDSGRFLFPNTKPRTFKHAAYLLEKGKFDLKSLHENLYKKTLVDLKMQGHILTYFQTKDDVIYYIASKNIQQEFNLSANEVARYNNLLAGVENYLIWLFFVELEDGSYRVRLRSMGPKVNKIATKFNGGGHDLASGASVKNYAEINKVIDAANAAIKKWRAKCK
ncbi:Bifunctional oligoribonuclease and PAP phosphatase nrnA [Mycoplasmopsis californica]|uniref:Bifunctional oligoribonuclease/PAP phosphatase NrnA n=1 Tax=Mycoplasmopsis equigenitalium TaxID=114883 RepID=A0ABY5J0S5_9BACT|nr:bifunctional oligoribonuclease/PAP phosphatase NrnA [Mycoplasmopsis equigenitalium]UUD36867.1 bifunctional oligoribonuclease/PAP phosphatase NrnA [Mycoplasmopsis equigenitalium]VEU69838.1 Bifunctional oligoribonuclease and PAP phosphatase nrnA [Mycoplasmopsis californica]